MYTKKMANVLKNEQGLCREALYDEGNKVGCLVGALLLAEGVHPDELCLMDGNLWDGNYDDNAPEGRARRILKRAYRISGNDVDDLVELNDVLAEDFVYNEANWCRNHEVQDEYQDNFNNADRLAAVVFALENYKDFEEAYYGGANWYL